jgi:hypothetical protein
MKAYTAMCLALLGFGFALFSTRPPEVGLGIVLASELAICIVAPLALRDIRTGTLRGRPLAVASLGIGILLIVFSVWSQWRIGWIGYYRLHLGMETHEVRAILGPPHHNWRPVRHLGGSFPPWTEEMPLSETGLPLANLLRGERAEDRPEGGTRVQINDDEADREVTVQQWWGATHGIDVAFDEDGRAVGIYLSWLSDFNH